MKNAINEAISSLLFAAGFGAGTINRLNVDKDGETQSASLALFEAANVVRQTINGQTLHTHLHFEAGLCIWEEMLDRIRLLDGKEWAKPMLAMEDKHGAVHMRHIALNLGATACAVWDLIGEEDRCYCVPYDWEFIPTFCAHLDWSDIENGTATAGDLGELAARIVVDCRARNFVTKA